MESEDFRIRPSVKNDESFLREMLYECIYVPPGEVRPPKAILNHPQLVRYVQNWGKATDLGLILHETHSSKNVGAVWIRLFDEQNKGYGYIDNQTPELSIAVLDGYRGKGLGGRLLDNIIKICQGRYKAISLSVTQENPALRLYVRFGFKILSKFGSSLILRKDLE